MSALRTLRRKLKADRDRRHQNTAGLRLEARNTLMLMRADAVREGMTPTIRARIAEAEAVLIKGRRGTPFRRHIPHIGKATIHATKGRVYRDPQAGMPPGQDPEGFVVGVVG